MNREQQEIDKVAEQYKRNGYDVQVEPAESDLPSFLGGFHPTMLAHKANEHVVVEVKADSQTNNHTIGYMTALVNSQPGWRFDLVVVDVSRWPDEVAIASKERDTSEILSLVQTAKSLLSISQKEAACLIAWAAVEATFRLVAEQDKLELDRVTPSVVVKTLYSVGRLSREEYDKIQSTMRYRNAIAHGLIVNGDIQEATEFLIQTAERFLSNNNFSTE